MLVLGIETATPVISVAVGDEEGIRGEVSLRAERGHMELLLPLADRLLADLGLGLEDLDGFAVGIGPGSFTSLRIGVATARAFAHALAKPLVGVPTLDVLAANLKGNPGLICSLLPARREEVYAAFYVSRHSELKRLSGYLALSVSQLASRLGENLRAPVTFVGEGARLHWGALKEKLGARALLAPLPAMWPRASGVVSLGVPLLGAARGRGEFCQVRPLYVRPPSVKLAQGVLRGV